MTEIRDIYSSVPEDSFEIPQEEIAKREPILNFLKENTGKFFTAREIAKQCGFPMSGTQVEVRKAITLLLEIDRHPIMSMSKGFGYVTKAHQMNFYADQLEERMHGLQRRIQAVRNIAKTLGEE